MKIDHVVFDVGGVLIDWNPEYLYRRLLPDDATRAWFLENVCNAAWNQCQDRGRSWQEAEAILIAEHPDWEVPIRAYRAQWGEMVPGPVPGGLELLADVSASGIATTALSNWSADTFAEMRQRFQELDQFTGLTISGEVKLSKPDPRIYKLHEERHRLIPSSTLFIDDSCANIKAARARGWQVLLHRDAQSTRAALIAQGLL